MSFCKASACPGRSGRCATSAARFPDGGQYRIEIPSTEGPRALAAVLDEAAKRQVPVHRVSQGSGIMLMTDDEIVEMLEIGRQAAIEVNLFIGPRATFDIGAQVFSAAGKTLGLSLRGADQLVFALEDVRRAVGLGLRSVLVSDIGMLHLIGRMKSDRRAAAGSDHQDVGDDGAGESRGRGDAGDAGRRLRSIFPPT